MNQLRVGLIGTAHWARTVHGPGLARHPGVQLVGVAGRRERPRAELAASLEVTAFADADELIDAVDVVAFAVPPDVQAALAVRAAAAGKHLLLDKPIALDAAAADAVAASVSAGVAAATYLPLRYSPAMTAWRHEIAERSADHLELDAVLLNAAAVAPDSPYRDSAWRHERGALWDLGPHALSISTAVLGPVRSASVSMTDGAVLARVHHEHGEGSMRLSLHSASSRTAFTVRVDDWVTTAPAVESDDVLYARFVDDLLAAVATGQPTEVGVAEAADAVRVLAAIDGQLPSAGASRLYP